MVCSLTLAVNPARNFADQIGRRWWSRGRGFALVAVCAEIENERLPTLVSSSGKRQLE